MLISEWIDNFAVQIAKYGHSIRLESIDELQNVGKHMEKMCDIHETLLQSGINSKLLSFVIKIKNAVAVLDTVSLADIIEYELLGELEKILDAAYGELPEIQISTSADKEPIEQQASRDEIKDKIQLIEVSVAELFLRQNLPTGFNRWDIVVRYLAIEEYYGFNDVGFALYEKMQCKRLGLPDAKVDIQTFTNVIESWAREGYRTDSAIKADKDLKLVDGSHRMALALYHGLEEISCNRNNDFTSDINYGKEWFVTHGFTDDETEHIDSKCKELIDACSEYVNNAREG